MKRVKRKSYERTPEQVEAQRARMKAYWEAKRQEPVLPEPSLVEAPVAVLEGPPEGSDAIQCLCGDSEMVGVAHSTFAPCQKLEPVAVEEPVVRVLTEPPPALPQDQGRIGSRICRVILRTNGQMAVEDGPCWCGQGKRVWHATH